MRIPEARRPMNKLCLGAVLLFVVVGAGRGESEKPPRKEYAELPADIRNWVLEAERQAEALAQLDNVDFHKAAYKFATSPASEKGLSLTTSGGRAFADKMADLPLAMRARVLAAYQLGYRYATAPHSEGGLSLTTSGARTRAERWANLRDGLLAVAVHKAAFRYASASSSEKGLNLTSSGAADFADKIAPLEDGLKVLAIHKKAYLYASGSASEGGLNL